MGLRFRKSITLCKGVKLNFGKTCMSISTGIPGCRSTYNFTTGKTTRSIGIPGTGISYVTTTGGNRAQRSTAAQRATSTQRNNEPRYSRGEEFRTEQSVRSASQLSYAAESETVKPVVPDDAFVMRSVQPQEITPLERLKSIHFSTDDMVDWTEILISDKPSADCDNVEFWNYCHERAYQILNGDIDSYLEVIRDVNPLDDLLDYGFGFECGTEHSNTMVVEFSVKENEILPHKSTMIQTEYNDLLQDYICSCAIRVARDIFALLPVSFVIVHAVLNDCTVLSVKFDRKVFLKMKFQGADASNLLSKFKNNMIFNRENGFSPVEQIEN